MPKKAEESSPGGAQGWRGYTLDYGDSFLVIPFQLEMRDEEGGFFADERGGFGSRWLLGAEPRANHAASSAGRTEPDGASDAGHARQHAREV